MTTKRKSNFRGQVAEDSRRQEKAASSYGHLLLPKGINVFSPDPDGRYKLDFLPYVVTDPKHPDRNPDTGAAIEGNLWYKRPYWIHRNVGVENETVVCLRSIKKQCPVCDYRAKRVKEGADKEELESIKQSLRNLYIVVPLDSKNNDAKPHIFDISQYNFQVLLNEELKDKPEFEIFPDLEEGITIKVRFESKVIGKKGQPFAQASRIDFLERDEQYTEDILEQIPSLDEVLKVLSFKELEALFLEEQVLGDEEDGGKLKPAKEDNEEKEERPARRSMERTERPARTSREEQPDKEEEEKKPERTMTRNTPSRGSTEKGKEKCPYGHEFGADTEKFNDCDECRKYDDCLDEKERK